MPRGIVYENDYIVGGKPTTSVTPNFRLSEYAAANGRLFVHRELVTAVQILRDRLQAPIRISSLAARQGLGSGRPGLFVWLEATAIEALRKVAIKMIRDGILQRAELRESRLLVEVPDPNNLPAIKPELAFVHAILVTAGFETSGNPYLQVTGNFDGAGLSFGPIQVNFGTGTLPKVFQRLEAVDASALRRCFGPDYDEWQGVLKLSRKKQVDWADRLSTGSRKAGFQQPWKSHLQAVGQKTKFQKEMHRYAYDVYGRKLIVALSWLWGLFPMRIDNFRCLAALYDLCVQQGSLDKAHAAIRSRVMRDKPQNQFELVRIAVEERGRKANPRWRADAISRRLTILDRAPVRVYESGQTASRDNRMLFLLRNAPVKNVERYLL